MIFIKNPEANNVITVYSSDKKWYLTFIRINAEWNTAKWVIKNDSSDKPFKKEYILDINEVPHKLLLSMFAIIFEDAVKDFKKIL